MKLEDQILKCCNLVSHFFSSFQVLSYDNITVLRYSIHAQPEAQCAACAAAAVEV